VGSIQAWISFTETLDSSRSSSSIRVKLRWERESYGSVIFWTQRNFSSQPEKLSLVWLNKKFRTKNERAFLPFLHNVWKVLLLPRQEQHQWH